MCPEECMHISHDPDLQVQLIACEMCDERFVYRSLLRKHVKSVHDHNKVSLSMICDFEFIYD